MYLEHINAPADVQSLSMDRLPQLCREIRTALLQKLSAHGGHIGPNLGMVEATVALHYVFHSPDDKFVFDVSHQSYAHKMLTGRREAFVDAAHYEDVSGYTEPSESPHDHFVIGHTSTSVSLALGLAKGRDLVGGKENIIAVIGDGSLSGGEALEGLSVAAELGTNFIIVVNDNEMSIAENHGGLYRSLAALRASGGTEPCNLFRAMGLDYVYVAQGNDTSALIDAFRRVKDIDHPVVVHIHTLKGKGYKYAEQEKERFHWGYPFDLATGVTRPEYVGGEDYHDLTATTLLAEMKADPAVVAITAGTPAVLGFTADRRAIAGKQFVDVGIAEETAVAMASGIAARGGKPVFGVYSSFIQRAYDQLSQDLCINGNAATLLVYLGTITGMNDVTHLGFFDIPLIANIPNMVYLAPTSCQEYLSMLHWSLHQTEHPVAIRVPADGMVEVTQPVAADYSDLNRYLVTQRGRDVAVLALGSYYRKGEEVCRLLREQHGLDATLVNPRYITGLDTDLLDALRADHRLVVTLEDGVLDGGWGEKIARYYAATPMRVLCKGARKAFADRFDYHEILSDNRLLDEQIVEDIVAALQ
jgi:1-deoxy-D-xylulose-5-phosphate synthase